MATLNQIIYDIKERFNAYSDDIKLSDEHISFLFQNKRNTYMKNYISNLKKELPLEAMQEICLSFTEDELCEDDALFLISNEVMPGTLESTGRSNISQAFLNSRLSKWINIVNYERWPYIKTGGRYNSKQLYITQNPNSKILIYSPSGNHELIEEMKFNNIFENPEEAFELQCIKDSKCDFFDSTYPIESSMIDPISREIVNELIIKYRIPVDTVNNSEDDTVNKNNLDAKRRTKAN